MWVFRLALTVIFLVLVLLVGVIEHVITWVVGKFNPDACLRMRSGYIRCGLKLVWLAAAGKTTEIGLDRSPAGRPGRFPAQPILFFLPRRCQPDKFQSIPDISASHPQAGIGIKLPDHPGDHMLNYTY